MRRTITALEDSVHLHRVQFDHVQSTRQPIMIKQPTKKVWLFPCCLTVAQVEQASSQRLSHVTSISVIGLRAVLWSGWLGAQVLVHVALTWAHRGRHGRLGIPLIYLKPPLLLQSHPIKSAVHRACSILISRQDKARQGQAGQGTARQGKARQGKARTPTSLQGC